MHGVQAVQDDARRTGAGQGRRNFLSDIAGLANADDNQFTALPEGLDDDLHRRIKGPIEAAAHDLESRDLDVKDFPRPGQMLHEFEVAIALRRVQCRVVTLDRPPPTMSSDEPAAIPIPGASCRRPDTRGSPDSPWRPWKRASPRCDPACAPATDPPSPVEASYKFPRCRSTNRFPPTRRVSNSEWRARPPAAAQRFFAHGADGRTHGRSPFAVEAGGTRAPEAR